MPKLMDVLIDAAELLDWSVHIYDDCIEFEKYSPAGEDFIFTITGNDEARVAEQVREYAYDFDPDEHAEMWVESRGKRGVPDSIRTLIDDADAIKEMAFELPMLCERQRRNTRRRWQDDSGSGCLPGLRRTHCSEYPDRRVWHSGLGLPKVRCSP